MSSPGDTVDDLSNLSHLQEEDSCIIEIDGHGPPLPDFTKFKKCNLKQDINRSQHEQPPTKLDDSNCTPSFKSPSSPNISGTPEVKLTYVLNTNNECRRSRSFSFAEGQLKFVDTSSMNSSDPLARGIMSTCAKEIIPASSSSADEAVETTEYIATEKPVEDSHAAIKSTNIEKAKKESDPPQIPRPIPSLHGPANGAVGYSFSGTNLRIDDIVAENKYSAAANTAATYPNTHSNKKYTRTRSHTQTENNRLRPYKQTRPRANTHAEGNKFRQNQSQFAQNRPTNYPSISTIDYANGLSYPQSYYPYQYSNYPWLNYYTATDIPMNSIYTNSTAFNHGSSTMSYPFIPSTQPTNYPIYSSLDGLNNTDQSHPNKSHDSTQTGQTQSNDSDKARVPTGRILYDIFRTATAVLKDYDVYDIPTRSEEERTFCMKNFARKLRLSVEELVGLD